MSKPSDTDPLFPPLSSLASGGAGVPVGSAAASGGDRGRAQANTDELLLDELRGAVSFKSEAHEVNTSAGLEAAAYAGAAHAPPRATRVDSTEPDSKVLINVTLPQGVLGQAGDDTSGPRAAAHEAGAADSQSGSSSRVAAVTASLGGVPQAHSELRDRDKAQRHLPTGPKLQPVQALQPVGQGASSDAPVVSGLSGLSVHKTSATDVRSTHDTNAHDHAAPSRRGIPMFVWVLGLVAAFVVAVGAFRLRDHGEAQGLPRGTDPASSLTLPTPAASATGRAFVADSATSAALASATGTAAVEAPDSGHARVLPPASGLLTNPKASAAHSVAIAPTASASASATPPAPTGAYSGKFSEFHQETIK